MEILKSLFRSIVRLVAINIALILFFASAPLLYVTVPFWAILSEGGMFCTVGKSIGFMVMGWFGSALAEFAFCGAAGNLLHSTTGRLEFFAMAPFAVFAPIWLVLLCRWMRSRKREDFISRAKGDRELRETMHAISIRAKACAARRRTDNGTCNDTEE